MPTWTESSSRRPAGIRERLGAPRDSVIDLLLQQADQALIAAEGVNFENKIVLSIATRVAENTWLPNSTVLISPRDHGELGTSAISGFQNRKLGTPGAQETLDDVVLMTPENIHVNSFHVRTRHRHVRPGFYESFIHR